MRNYRYILDPSSKKFNCPSCKKKRFVRYIDTETNTYIKDEFGRCDRESNCQYHLSPQQADKSPKFTGFPPSGNEWRKPQPIAFLPENILKETLTGYERNQFIQNLLNDQNYGFEQEAVEKVISLYYLGTVTEGYRMGGLTIPFIDVMANIRAIQVKQFDSSNHTISTDFLHSIIEKGYSESQKTKPEWLLNYMNNEKKVSCLFGEHLLSKYPYTPIALVEAPKTAILATLYFGFPEEQGAFLWLAVFNLSSLNLERCKVLEGRTIYLFPDLSHDGSSFKKWNAKANLFNMKLKGTKFIVSDLLENYASNEERKKGLDLADFLTGRTIRSV